MKIYLGKSFSLNFRHRFDSDGMFEIQARKSLSVKVVRISRDSLPPRTEFNQTEPFFLLCTK